MSWMEKYNQWLNTPGLDVEIKNALLEKKTIKKNLKIAFIKISSLELVECVEKSDQGQTV